MGTNILYEPSDFIFRAEEAEKCPDLKKEAAGFTRMLVHFDQIARHHDPESITLHTQYLFFT
jgi:hypothetical protein